ncbi:LysR substrate-binding domain-containing protein [Kiloniella antarctica]|uniref:LysR substrate-binding domain-containing protein n=1 Tax=Kiloniella antarctica TaxID=1550907 RepID=A0ABW5BLH3_9PROT
MRRTLPSTRALICFEAAARYENFTQAAIDVNLTQSALSRQINLLEELLEQKLFERIRQRVKLTSAGQHYLLQIQPLLATLEIATIRMPEFQEIRGGLNIGTYPTLGSRWLLEHLMAFAAEYPDINTNTITYLDNKQFDPNAVDIGIIQGDPNWPGCQNDFLMPEELAPVISSKLVKNINIDINVLSSYRLLQHSTRPQSWDIWFQSAGLQKPEMQGSLFFSQFEMIIEATLAGHGIAMLPIILIQRELADGRLTLAHSHIANPQVGYHLISSKSKSQTKKIEAFRHWILSRTKIQRHA